MHNFQEQKMQVKHRKNISISKQPEPTEGPKKDDSKYTTINAN